MTFDDNNAAVELAAETLAMTVGKVCTTQTKLVNEWGRGEKKTNKEQQALVFANSLLSVQGTFEFTQEMRDFGYSTIWEAMAGELYDPAAKAMQKAQNAEALAHVYQNGCNALSAKLREQWNDAVIYTVPRTVNGLLIEVVTVNADKIVNAAGDTVYDIWEAREMKRVKGQIKSATVKLARATSKEQALAVIAAATSTDNLLSYVKDIQPGKLEPALEAQTA